MKQKLIYLFVLLGAAFIAGGRTAEAQVTERVDATIPFQFHAGGAQLPAGEYAIRSVSSGDGSLMEIQSADGKTSALFETEQSDTNAKQNTNELVFNHVGDQYYLSEIVDADDGTGAEVFNGGSPETPDAAKASTGKKHIFAVIHIL